MRLKMRWYREILISTPPLVEAADTPPFFHDNNAATIEDAVAFYTTEAFDQALDAAAGGGAFRFNGDEVNQVAAFLRMINALENIRSSNAYDARPMDSAERVPADWLANLGLAETTDAMRF